jgi:hypothetical protein
MPVTGWSTTGGDLRVPHFIGVHGLQVLPLFALAVALLAVHLPRLRDERLRLRLVWTFAGFYAGLMVLTTWQALRGQPVARPDLPTIGALGVLVAATMAMAVWAVRAARRPVPARAREEVLV